jgi:hypothetical protein
MLQRLVAACQPTEASGTESVEAKYGFRSLKRLVADLLDAIVEGQLIITSAVVGLDDERQHS